MHEGTKFGLLTILAMVPGKRKYTLCRCDCGAEKRVRFDHLRAGKIISCGCEGARRTSARAGKLHEANITHGNSGTRAHAIWFAIRQRCNNPNATFYNYYGGRGIKICDRWNEFQAFLDDMGQPPLGYTIDRIDNEGDYKPSNCRWATRQEQQNNRRGNRRITHEGSTHTLAEWSRLTGLLHNTIASRLDRGWPIAKALTSEKFSNTSGLALGVEARRKKRQRIPPSSYSRSAPL